MSRDALTSPSCPPTASTTTTATTYDSSTACNRLRFDRVEQQWWESALAGVVIGGIIALAGAALIETWRERTRRSRERAAEQRRLLQERSGRFLASRSHLDATTTTSGWSFATRVTPT